MPEEIKTEEPKINIDALGAPEGTEADKFELYKGKEETITQPVHNFNGLPNLDPSKEDTVEEVKEEAKIEAPKAEAPVAKTEAEISSLHKPFKALQKKLGLTDEEFKIPEGITEENWQDKYDDLILENIEVDEIDPEVKKINDLIKGGMPREQAISTYQKMNDLISLSDKEIMTLSLKQQFGKTEERKDGWDDAKIEERISKMDNSGLLEIEAEKIRNNIKQEKEQINTRYAEQNKKAIANRSAELIEKRNTEVSKSLEYLKGVKDVYGLPVGKAELQQFENDFKLLVTPNEKGIAPLNEYLQSNENLVKVAFMILNGDSKVKTSLTKAKEDAKKSIIEKLDDEPKLPKKTSSPVKEGEIDLNAMEAPAR